MFVGKLVENGLISYVYVWIACSVLSASLTLRPTRPLIASSLTSCYRRRWPGLLDRARRSPTNTSPLYALHSLLTAVFHCIQSILLVYRRPHEVLHPACLSVCRVRLSRAETERAAVGTSNLVEIWPRTQLSGKANMKSKGQRSKVKVTHCWSSWKVAQRRFKTYVLVGLYADRADVPHPYSVKRQ